MHEKSEGTEIIYVRNKRVCYQQRSGFPFCTFGSFAYYGFTKSTQNKKNHDNLRKTKFNTINIDHARYEPLQTNHCVIAKNQIQKLTLCVTCHPHWPGPSHPHQLLLLL